LIYTQTQTQTDSNGKEEGYTDACPLILLSMEEK